MASHHFLGTGPYSGSLAHAERDPASLLDDIAALVDACGFEVVFRNASAFTNGGLTLVWVLAESHMVMHYWGDEGFATIDLHICDYHRSNARKAERLVELLDERCFVPRTSMWEQLSLKQPGVPVAGP